MQDVGSKVAKLEADRAALLAAQQADEESLRVVRETVAGIDARIEELGEWGEWVGGWVGGPRGGERGVLVYASGVDVIVWPVPLSLQAHADVLSSRP
jgi:hypothetical protein